MGTTISRTLAFTDDARLPRDLAISATLAFCLTILLSRMRLASVHGPSLLRLQPRPYEPADGFGASDWINAMYTTKDRPKAVSDQLLFAPPG
jgi:hypothetical protein